MTEKPIAVRWISEPFKFEIQMTAD